jgi:hypothetical protein
VLFFCWFTAAAVDDTIIFCIEYYHTKLKMKDGTSNKKVLHGCPTLLFILYSVLQRILLFHCQ